MVKRFSSETLALLSGLMLALSFPPFDLFFLAWVAWIPLWIALQQGNWMNGFRLGYITGFIFTLSSLNWIANNLGTSFWVASASMISAVLYVSLYFGLFGLILSRTGRNLGTKGFWLAPFFWVSIEYLFSYHELVLAFPWISLAMTQNGILPILQISEYGGIYAVSFWVLLLNTVIFQLEFGRLTLRTQQLLWGTLGFAIVGSLIFGAVRMKVIKESAQTSIRVAVIQTNLDPKEKWVRKNKIKYVRDLLDLSEKAVEDSASIIIWYESAVPAHLHYYPQIDRLLRKFVESNNVSLLTGALHHVREGDEYKFYNSAFFYAPGLPVQIYSKQRLVPFGERLPLVETFPILKNLNFGQANFEPGTEASVYPMGSDSMMVPLGTLICYESADPHVFQKFIENEADMMSIITNDAWLGRSLGPTQHLAAGRIRAIEHRISIARSAQTGISAFIQPNGRISKSIPLGERGYFVVDAPIGLDRTFYSIHGDVFVLGVLLISALGLLIVLFTRSRTI